MRKITPFTQGHLSDVLRNCKKQLQDKINSEDQDYLLNVNEEEYLEHLVSEFTIDPPVINFDEKYADQVEKEIPADRHPSHAFFLEGGRSYKRQVIIYYLPFSGEIQMLNFQPSPGLLWTDEFGHENDDNGEVISFEVVNFTNNLEEVKRAADQKLGNLQTQLGHIQNQIRGYNSEIRSEAESAVRARKKDLLAKSDFLSGLGVPIKKRGNLPETFSVPAPKIPKKIVPKPSVSPGSPPDPTLDDSTYQEILGVIHDLGKAIERMPSTYEGKGEEDLRDHFLMTLEPRFEGSATGETFNKTGKTDILLRYESKNVFIAECKFWGGESKYLETIDQILGYLTWRDSKAAIVLFVKNVEFTPVLSTVRDATPKHSNFVSFDGEKEEGTWQTYKVHLNGDPERIVHLNVLLFHYPPIGK